MGSLTETSRPPRPRTIRPSIHSPRPATSPSEPPSFTPSSSPRDIQLACDPLTSSSPAVVVGADSPSADPPRYGLHHQPSPIEKDSSRLLLLLPSQLSSSSPAESPRDVAPPSLFETSTRTTSALDSHLFRSDGSFTHLGLITFCLTRLFTQL